MVELKREYVVPLRKKTKLAPKWRRSKKAVSVLNDFVRKHMKTDEVIICKELNEKIWENGIKNPPGKVSIIALKTQINGIDKTLVNLSEVGVDSHMKLYKQTTKVSAKKEAKESKEVKEEVSEIKEAEVKEVEKPTEEVEASKEAKEVKEE